MTSINLNEIAVRVTRDYINDLIESKFALRVELARVEAERETLREKLTSTETVLDFFVDMVKPVYETIPFPNEWIGSEYEQLIFGKGMVAGAKEQQAAEQAKLWELAELWRERPAGLARFASHYGNTAWVDAFERALGVEK